MGTVPVDLVDVGLRALPVVIHLFFSEAYMALPKLCFLLIDSIISVNIKLSDEFIVHATCSPSR